MDGINTDRLALEIQELRTEHRQDQEATAERRMELGWKIEQLRLRLQVWEQHTQRLERVVYVGTLLLITAVAALALRVLGGGA